MSTAPTVVRVIAVEDGAQLDCCDEETTHVWVRVIVWSPRRAFLTGAAPFAEAAGKPALDLAGARFIAQLDVDNPPSNTDTNGERLQWPGLRYCPPFRPGGFIPAPVEGQEAAR
ncbi:hypothetical protein ABZT26_03120 [Streptomyces sp. NPDC005395]|uniref:hypothetical protein n=1 Tax=Streptomyces sp. NPDC005395 TaxID=3157042 RepID=UPI0033B7CAE4